MLNALPNWIYVGLFPLVGGLLYAAGFPMLGTEASLFFSPILGTGLLLIGIHRICELKKNFFLTIIPYLLFSFGYYQLGYYWIPYTLREFGAIAPPFNYILGFFFSAIILPQYFFALIWYRYVHPGYEQGWNKVPIIGKIIIASAALTLLEYALPTQFPAHIGHAWMSLTPYLRPAQYIGSPGYSMISFLGALGFGYYLSRKDINALLPLAAPAILLIVGLASPIQKKSGDMDLKIRLVQANIGNNTKLTAEQGLPNSLSTVLGNYERLSISGNREVDLVIWPETSYPLLLSADSLRSSPSHFPPVIQNLVRLTRSHLYFGGYDQSESNGSLYKSEYNTTFMVDDELKLTELYHKIRLIPFGEGLPFGPLNPFLSKIIKNISYFAEGTRFSEFEIKGWNFTAAICYEILFTDFIREYLNSVARQPHFIINSTNDSWYGNTSEPYQHLFLSKWRAVEFNTPIIRSTNTGITSVIYNDGTESKRMKIGEMNFMDLVLNGPGTVEPTVYQVWGYIPVITLTIAMLALSFLVPLTKMLRSPLSKDHEV